MNYLVLFPTLFLVISTKEIEYLQSEISKVIGDFQPQQIHLSFAGKENEMFVTWVTTNQTQTSQVSFSNTLNLDQIAEGHSRVFVDGGNEKRTMWINRVHLKNLKPNSRYIYRCGSEQGWSEIFFFRTVNSGVDWAPKIALYGDMGLINPQSLTRLQVETQNGMYDTVIHVGDFAYDMHDDNARVGDGFMNTIQPIAAYVPYMTCPGNHEEKYNFSNYKSRFSMPLYQQWENMFYSWDLGPVHFISVNTEAYYYLQYGIAPLVRMYNWLERDLKKATEPEARKERPWIILYGHRPMYCSNADGDDCTHKFCLTRVGLPVFHWFGMEKLLMQYGVDLVVWAHEHSYERLWPLYDYKVQNGTRENPYDNPSVPIHIITGSAGCKERKDSFVEDQPYWSAFRSNDYGYSRMTVANKTHINWQQVSDDQNGKIIDEIWIIRRWHEKYYTPTKQQNDDKSSRK